MYDEARVMEPNRPVLEASTTDRFPPIRVLLLE
jgi:hypothetical protein